MVNSWFLVDYFRNNNFVCTKLFSIFHLEIMAKKSIGFGDDVEKIITLTRLDRIAKLVKNGECSECEKRKNKLNKLLPYGKTK